MACEKRYKSTSTVITKYHRQWGLFFLVVMDVRNLSSGCQQVRYWWKLSGVSSSHVFKWREMSSFVSLLRWAVNHHEDSSIMTSSKPNFLKKSLFTSTINSEFRTSIYEFGGGHKSYQKNQRIRLGGDIRIWLRKF